MKVLSPVSHSYSLTNCVICKKELVGRRDKKFCSLKCKNTYRDLRAFENHLATNEIDRKLHRNRTILTELHSEAKSPKFIAPRNRLIRKGFSFNHFTTSSVNKEGKIYLHVYDYAWMEFSTTDVLVIHKKVKPRSPVPKKAPGTSLAKN